MNRSTLARIAALVIAGVATTLTTLMLVDRDGHRDAAASVKVGQSPSPHGHTTTPTRPPDNPAHTFTLSGQVAGLYPGGTRDLTVRITNPGNIALRVTTVQVTVRDASSVCRASNLVASSYSGRAYVGKHATVSVTVPVRMVRTAPDACQNATFPLVFHAEAVKA